MAGGSHLAPHDLAPQRRLEKEKLVKVLTCGHARFPLKNNADGKHKPFCSIYILYIYYLSVLKRIKKTNYS